MNIDLTEYFGISFSAKNPRTGQPIQFKLKPGEHTYLYFNGPNKAQYCYTPHKDIQGWYYSFAYIPQGPGSRTGNPKQWKLKMIRPHRTRKAAKKRALQMRERAITMQINKTAYFKQKEGTE